MVLWVIGFSFALSPLPRSIISWCDESMSTRFHGSLAGEFPASLIGAGSADVAIERTSLFLFFRKRRRQKGGHSGERGGVGVTYFPLQ